jgi:hypothetical protein
MMASLRRDLGEHCASGAERKLRRAPAAPASSSSLQDRLGNRGLLRLVRAARGVQRKAAAERGETRRAALEREADDSAARVSGVPSPRSRSVPLADPSPLGSGLPLPEATRTHMEAELGHRFGDVRIHTDATADAATRSLGAVAFTRGSDLAFRDGAFEPHTAEGRNLLAHELVHVVQQRTRADAPRAQARVVDDDAHFPCRTVVSPSRPGRMTAAGLTAIETAAAALATAAAAALRADPVSEPTRRRLWERFRLDYNDPRIRCRQVVAIAERYEQVARAIRTRGVHYPCSLAGEPEPTTECSHADAYTYVGLGTSISLCSTFWNMPTEQAPIMLHEWIHLLFLTRGAGDDLTGGFDTAACYATFAVEVGGGSTPSTTQPWQCPVQTEPLPVRDATRIADSCPGNVYQTLTFTPLFNYGLLGGPRIGGALGLDFNIPLTTMHDWELTLGPRLAALAPLNPMEREVYTAGLRLGFAFRYRPWRFGGDVGGYLEPGAAVIPSAPPLVVPYVGTGLSTGFNFGISPAFAMRLFVDVGGGLGWDTRSSSLFPFFQSGLNLALEFR